MSEAKLYTVKITADELSLIRTGIRRLTETNKESILEHRKSPWRAEDEDFSKWHKEDVETCLILMELKEKIYSVE